MFEAGRLIARIALEGSETVARQVDAVKKHFSDLGDDGYAKMSKLGTGVGLVSAGILAFAGYALKSFAEFDKAMSSVQASTHASAEDMGLLRSAAVKAGADTAFSATEAANAIDELSKAGVTTTDVLGGALTGSLALAAAGELGVADAASIAATAMTQFKKTGADVPHIADLLAAGAGKAQGSVSDLAAALNQGGLVASQAGFSIEETTGTLAAFASAGLLGSDAGTSLKTAILALQAPSAQSSGLMRKYGIDVYDSSGKMKSFDAISKNLRSSLSGLTEEQRNSTLATIFGTDAVRAAGVLYSAVGDSSIASWTDKVNDSGYAAETARLKMNNLSGDLEYLKGSIDSGLIQSGSALNDQLRELVQVATLLVNGIGSLPAPLLEAGLGFIAFLGSAGLLSAGLLKGIPLYKDTKEALQGIGFGGKSAALGLAAASAGLALVAAGIGSYLGYLADMKQGAGDFAATLDPITAGVQGSTRALLEQKLATEGTYEQAKKAGVGQAELTNAILNGGKALDDVNAKLTGKNNVVDFFNGSGFAASEAAAKTHDLRQQLVDAKKNTLDQKASADAAAASGDTFTESLEGTSAAAADTTGGIKSLSDAIASYGSEALSAAGASRSFEAALDDAEKAAKKNGRTAIDHGNALEIDTEKGRANQAALFGIAEAANKAAAANYTSNGSLDQAAGTLDRARDKFIAVGKSMGLSERAAKRYADQLLKTPESIKTQVKLDGIPVAERQIAEFRRKLGLLGQLKTVAQITAEIQAAPVPGGGVLKKSHDANGSITSYFADGGFTDTQHIAQIAAAGTTRVWNEPETGGEAYIPLASSKRDRSEAILDEVARQFGKQVVDPHAPAGSRKATRRAVPSINLTVMHPSSSDPVEDSRYGAQLALSAALGDFGED